MFSDKDTIDACAKTSTELAMLPTRSYEHDMGPLLVKYDECILNNGNCANYTIVFYIRNPKNGAMIKNTRVVDLSAVAKGRDVLKAEHIATQVKETLTNACGDLCGNWSL